jgi:chromosome partitioning protein
MARVISITGQKGGVGKTTSCIHIGAFLASQGFKVAIIDFDTTQANATRSLLGKIWDDYKDLGGICDVILNDTPIDNVVYETSRENLFIVPSEKVDKRGQNYNIEAALTQLGMDGFTMLSDQITSSKVLQEMNFIIIDNAPSLGITTVSSLVASDYYLIPVQTTDFSMESIHDTLETAKKVKSKINKSLEPLGFFISSMDKRPKLAKKAASDMEQLAKDEGIHFFKTKIPISSKFSFLARNKETIYDQKGSAIRGKKEYFDLSKEILSRMMEIEKGSAKIREVRA